MNTQRGTRSLKGHSVASPCRTLTYQVLRPLLTRVSELTLQSAVCLSLFKQCTIPLYSFFFFLECSLVSFHPFFTSYEIHKDPMNPSDPKPSTSILKTRGTMSIISSPGLTLSAPLDCKLPEERPCALGPPSLIIASYLTGGHMGVSLPPEHTVQASSSTNSHQGHFPHGGTTASS